MTQFIRHPLLIALTASSLAGCVFFDADDECPNGDCAPGDGDGDAVDDPVADPPEVGDGDGSLGCNCEHDGTGGDTAAPMDGSGSTQGIEPGPETGGMPAVSPPEDPIASDLELLMRYLHINEMIHGGSEAVELYNSGDRTIDLSLISVGRTGDFGNLCQLTGALQAGQFTTVQKFEEYCVHEDENCFRGCDMHIGDGTDVSLYANLEGTLEEVDTASYLDPSSLPLPGNSLSMVPDGSGNWSKTPRSLGVSNEE